MENGLKLYVRKLVRVRYTHEKLHRKSVHHRAIGVKSSVISHCSDGLLASKVKDLTRSTRSPQINSQSMPMWPEPWRAWFDNDTVSPLKSNLVRVKVAPELSACC